MNDPTPTPATSSANTVRRSPTGSSLQASVRRLATSMPAPAATNAALLNRVRWLLEEPDPIRLAGRDQLHPVEYESRRGTAGDGGHGGSGSVAPFGPRSVVDADVVVAEQVGQHEPGGGGSAAYGAVRDDVADWRCGDRRKLLAEFVDGTEPASVVADVVDRQVYGGGNVPGATRWLGCPGRPEPVALEFGEAADIDNRRRSSPNRSLNHRIVGPNAWIRRGQRVPGRRAVGVGGSVVHGRPSSIQAPREQSSTRTSAWR